jgi:outer membrane protein assembly factor BamA
VSAEISGIARFSGLRVSDIQVVGAEVEEQRLRALIQQQINQPLDKEKVRRSIRGLYSTGRFSDIQVDAQREPGNQVRLIFRAEENRFIGIITLEGAPKKAPAPNQIINSTRLELGELFSEDKVKQAAEHILEILREHGYYQSKVTWEARPRAGTDLMDIHYLIQTGDIARVGQVIFRGEPGVPDAELRDVSNLDPGDKVTQDRQRKALRTAAGSKPRFRSSTGSFMPTATPWISCSTSARVPPSTFTSKAPTCARERSNAISPSMKSRRSTKICSMRAAATSATTFRPVATLMWM